MKHIKTIIVTTLLTSALLSSGIASAGKYNFNVCVYGASLGASGSINATVNDYRGSHNGNLQTASSYCSQYTYISNDMPGNQVSLNNSVAIRSSSFKVNWSSNMQNVSGTCTLPAAYAVPITFYPIAGTSDYKSSKILYVSVTHDATKVTGCTAYFQ